MVSSRCSRLMRAPRSPDRTQTTAAPFLIGALIGSVRRLDHLGVIKRLARRLAADCSASGAGLRRRCDRDETRTVGPRAGNLPVVIRLTPVRRLGRRALLLFGAYTAVILAVVIAGFLGGAIGIWASVLWGAVLLGGLVLYLRRRRRPRIDP